MKTLKTLMALVVALCSTFAFTSCDEDDVNDAVTFSNYELRVSTTVEGDLQSAIVDVFAPQLSSYSKQLTNVNQLAARKVFDLAVGTLDATVQTKVNEFAASVAGPFTVTISLVNTADGNVVTSKSWAPTTTTPEVQ